MSVNADPAGPSPLPSPERLAADCKQVAQRLERDFPADAVALDLAGRIYYSFNDTARADGCWRACLKLAPDFVEAWWDLGQAAWEHGEFAEAAARLKKAASLHPQVNPTRLFVLADSLLNAGDARSAAEALERAGRETSLPPFALFLMGHAHLDLGENEKARDDFQSLLAADPRSANAHFGLVTAYNRLHQPENAARHRTEYARLRKAETAEFPRLRADLRKADFADPRPAARECYTNAGKIYANQQRFDAAEDYWLRAAAVDPQAPEPRKLLQMLYNAQGRQEDAVRIAPSPPGHDPGSPLPSRQE